MLQDTEDAELTGSDQAFMAKVCVLFVFSAWLFMDVPDVASHMLTDSGIP